MRRTKEEAEATKQNILDAALAVFSRKGYKGSRMGDIARHANVTTGAIYHHFGGKSELFLALLEKSEQKANQIALQVVEQGGTPANVLRNLLVRVFKFVEEDKEYRAVYELFTSKTEFSPELSKITQLTAAGRRQLAHYFSNLIIKGIEMGEFRPDVSPEDTGIALVGYINGIGLIWVQDPGHFSIKQRAEVLVDSFLNGILIRNPS